MELEKRIKKDANGFYCVQIRVLPVADWEPNDGWGTVFETTVYANAVSKLVGIKGRQV